jgi:hypothetical protein
MTNRYDHIKRGNALRRQAISRYVVAQYEAGVSTSKIAGVINKNVKTVQRLLTANGVQLSYGPRRRLRNAPTRLFGPAWLYQYSAGYHPYDYANGRDGHF